MVVKNVNGAEAWAKELEKLMDKAHVVESLEDRLALTKEFRLYIRKSHPQDASEISALRDLDRMAKLVAENLMIDVANDRLKTITAVAGDLTEAQKAFEGAAASNAAAAKSIRLDNAKAVVAGATDVLKSFNSVRADLGEEGGSTELGARVDNASRAVREARDLMLRLGLGG